MRVPPEIIIYSRYYYKRGNMVWQEEPGSKWGAQDLIPFIIPPVSKNNKDNLRNAPPWHMIMYNNLQWEAINLTKQH